MIREKRWNHHEMSDDEGGSPPTDEQPDVTQGASSIDSSEDSGSNHERPRGPIKLPHVVEFTFKRDTEVEDGD
jgi:hypothetical protein